MRHVRELPSALGWPWPPALLPVLLVWVGWSWWTEIAAQSRATGIATAADAGSLAWLALGGRGLATLTEAAVYALWWKARGAHLPYWRFAAWVAAISAADLFGFALGRATTAAPDFVRGASIVLAGPRGGSGGALESGLMAAFGNFGVLTLVRIGVTAWAQARGTGRPGSRALLVTGHAWLLTRFATWWSFDLLRGMSPVR